MRLQLDRFGTIKNWVHLAQAATLSLCWILTIALLTRPGSTDGRVGWYFGLCWLTIPILVYLVMVPMWSRARKFANVYAFAVVDSLSALFWLSAWAAIASYVAAGKGKGDSTDPKKTGCDNFKYGSLGRCKLSETIIVFGVLEMVLFIATAVISFRAVLSFKRTGMMPENLPAGGTGGGKNDFSAQTQNDFSSNMRNDDEEDFDDQHGEGRDGRPDYAYQKPMDDAYAPIHQNDHDDIAHLPTVTPTSPLNSHGLGLNSYDTSYNPGAFAAGGQSQGPLHMPMPPR